MLFNWPRKDTRKRFNFANPVQRRRFKSAIIHLRCVWRRRRVLAPASVEARRNPGKTVGYTRRDSNQYQNSSIFVRPSCTISSFPALYSPCAIAWSGACLGTLYCLDASFSTPLLLGCCYCSAAAQIHATMFSTGGYPHPDQPSNNTSNPGTQNGEHITKKIHQRLLWRTKIENKFFLNSGFATEFFFFSIILELNC